MTTPSLKLVTSRAEVSIADVPWPVYKLLALAVGLLVLLVVGLITMNAAPAVVAAAASTAVVWIGLSLIHASDG